MLKGMHAILTESLSLSEQEKGAMWKGETRKDHKTK